MSDVSTGERPHILLVEDHALLRELQQQILEKQGFRVTVAASADDAVVLLSGGTHADILLSDVRMAGTLNGIALAHWTREHFPHMGILLQTAFTDSLTGDFPVLRKPFDPDTALVAIQQALRERRPASR